MTKSPPARPLRALWTIVGLWILGRAAWLVAEGAAAVDALRPAPEAGVAVVTEAPSPHAAPAPMPVPAPGMASNATVIAPGGRWRPGHRAARLARAPLAIPVPRPQPRPGTSLSPPTDWPGPPALASARPIAPRRAELPPTTELSRTTAPRWSGSLWSIARTGATPGLGAGGSQLGGSQAGVRIYRGLSPALALTARASAALASRQTEASLGIALHRGPAALLVERRFALDGGGRNDWSVTMAAGIDKIELPLGVRLGGYAQGGIVGRDGFADGALHLERPVLSRASHSLSVGVGSWGAIQPGAARLDIGPQLVARLPVAGRRVRVSAEWRQRVAGDAAPASGPAITLGADF